MKQLGGALQGNSPRPFASHVVATVAGAALSLAFAPFDLWLLAVLSPALLFVLWADATPRRAATLGFAFGAGMFAAGTYWLYVSIHGFGKAPLWLAIGLMGALVALMACYSTLLGYLATRFFPRRGWLRLLVGLPAGWVLLEWIRGWFLSGFGWLSLGYSQTDSWLAGWAPIGGVYLISLLVAIMSGALAMWWLEGRRVAKIAICALLVPWLVGALLERVEWTRAAGDPVGIAIVQGAIPQDEKWLLENRENSLRRYRDLTLSALGTPLIVWPEAAAPELANNLVPYLSELSRAAQSKGSSLLLGLIRAERREPAAKDAVRGEPQVEYFNSILALGEDIAWYDKHHLVPFGEFFPVPQYVRQWLRLMSLPYSDFTRGARSQPPLRIAGLALSASICYEDAYASSQLSAARESTALVNVTNDAWFGDSTARHQHLQISRMRAIEARRYLIRAANDGVSAVIGPQGEFVARAADFKTVVLRAKVTPRSGSSPYLSLGNWLVLVLATIGLAAAIVARKRTT